jgi:hypothetical protein
MRVYSSSVDVGGWSNGSDGIRLIANALQFSSSIVPPTVRPSLSLLDVTSNRFRVRDKTLCGLCVRYLTVLLYRHSITTIWRSKCDDRCDGGVERR